MIKLFLYVFYLYVFIILKDRHKNYMILNFYTKRLIKNYDSIASGELYDSDDELHKKIKEGVLSKFILKLMVEIFSRKERYTRIASTFFYYAFVFMVGQLIAEFLVVFI